MNYEIHLQVVGALLVVLAFIHVGFPKYLDWKNELPRLSHLNRDVMRIHTFFIALFVLMLGILCLSSAPLLVSTELGRRVSLGLSFFWGVRLICQFVGYSSKHWRGKTFETIVHILFAVFWAYITALFFMIGLVD